MRATFTIVMTPRSSWNQVQRGQASNAVMTTPVPTTSQRLT